MSARQRRRKPPLQRSRSQGGSSRKRKKKTRPPIAFAWRDWAYRLLIGMILVADVALLFMVVRQCTRPSPVLEEPVAERGEPAGAREPETRILKVEVLNGCGVPGIAARFTDFLRSRNFDVVNTENYESFNVEHTVVMDRRGQESNALRVAEALGLDRMRVLLQVNEAYLVDATVVLGRDFRQLSSWREME